MSDWRYAWNSIAYMDWIGGLDWNMSVVINTNSEI